MRGMYGSRIYNEELYTASPSTMAGSRGKQVREEDGFHTRPVRPNSGRRRVGFALAALACLVIAIFVSRAVGDRDERIQGPATCSDIFEPEICDLEIGQTP